MSDNNCQNTYPKTKYMRTSLFTLAFCCIAFYSDAQNFFRLKNRWKSTEYIHVEQPTPASSAIQPGWWSAQWTLEQEPGTAYYRIKNRWKNQYLQIEQGPLACSDIQPGWWSAQWQLERVAGTSFVRLRNRWKPDVAIHNQNGRLEAGPVDLGWWSAMWEMEDLNTPAAAATPSRPAPTTQPVPAQTRPATPPAQPATPALPSGNDARAFSPQHGGKVSVMFLRYTRVWPIADLQLKPGDRIYFFPQRIECNRDGANFNADNPALGGQTFTVQSVSPELKLDRDIPMMRNRNNDSFSMIIEVY